MNTLGEGENLLKVAEQALQKLVAQAAAQGEYAAVVQLASWARAIHDLAKTTMPPLTSHAETMVPTADRKICRAKSQRPNYPQFFRDTNCLIKVAWSKSSKSEYEHKAPKDVVQLLARSLKGVADQKELIAMDRVLPLRLASGEEVPSYQSYLCLAWMREHGFVRQHGRQGYSLKPSVNFESEVVKAWEALPPRSRR